MVRLELQHVNTLPACGCIDGIITYKHIMYIRKNRWWNILLRATQQNRICGSGQTPDRHGRRSACISGGADVHFILINKDGVASFKISTAIVNNMNAVWQ